MLKRVIATISAAAVIFLSVPALSQAAARNARQMAPLQYLIGTWHCSWVSGSNTGSEDQVFETALGGAWLAEKEIVLDRAGKPVVATIHYTGYDPKTGNYMHVGPDADGTFELAQSADAHMWSNPIEKTAFVHTKISDTKRTMVEKDRINGKPVTFAMTCTKAE